MATNLNITVNTAGLGILFLKLLYEILQLLSPTLTNLPCPRLPQPFATPYSHVLQQFV